MNIDKYISNYSLDDIYKDEYYKLEYRKCDYIVGFKADSDDSYWNTLKYTTKLINIRPKDVNII